MPGIRSYIARAIAERDLGAIFWAIAAGSITYLGKEVTAPPPGIAMVFQSFALFPWLIVLENVQLGLEALKLPPDEIRRRAIEAIGLDGFESAYALPHPRHQRAMVDRRIHVRGHAST